MSSNHAVHITTIFGEIVLKVGGIHLSVLVTSEAEAILTFFLLCPFLSRTQIGIGDK